MIFQTHSKMSCDFFCILGLLVMLDANPGESPRREMKVWAGSSVQPRVQNPSAGKTLDRKFA